MKAKKTPALFLLSSIPIFLTILLASPADVLPEIYPGEHNALIALLDSLTFPTRLLSNWTGKPCFRSRSRWHGVICSDSHVVSIFLDALNLTGSLPDASFHNLPYLTNLSLRDNSLHGDLPSLRSLSHLQEALFSRNRFTGEIPKDLLSLPNLSRLELQENRFNGTVPPLHQKSLVAFNVSYNFLEGGIPRTLRKFDRSSFGSNIGLCGKPLSKPCPSVAVATWRNASGVHLPVWCVVVVSATSFFVCLTVMFGFHVFRHWLNVEGLSEDEEEEEDDEITAGQFFDFGTLFSSYVSTYLGLRF